MVWWCLAWKTMKDNEMTQWIRTDINQVRRTST